MPSAPAIPGDAEPRTTQGEGAGMKNSRSGPTGAEDDDADVLDLLQLAGGSIYKRAIPAAAGVVVVAAVILYFVFR